MTSRSHSSATISADARPFQQNEQEPFVLLEPIADPRRPRREAPVRSGRDGTPRPDRRVPAARIARPARDHPECKSCVPRCLRADGRPPQRAVRTRTSPTRRGSPSGALRAPSASQRGGASKAPKQARLASRRGREPSGSALALSGAPWTAWRPTCAPAATIATRLTPTTVPATSRHRLMNGRSPCPD